MTTSAALTSNIVSLVLLHESRRLYRRWQYEKLEKGIVFRADILARFGQFGV